MYNGYYSAITKYEKICQGNNLYTENTDNNFYHIVEYDLKKKEGIFF